MRRDPDFDRNPLFHVAQSQKVEGVRTVVEDAAADLPELTLVHERLARVSKRPELLERLSVGHGVVVARLVASNKAASEMTRKRLSVHGDATVRAAAVAAGKWTAAEFAVFMNDPDPRVLLAVAKHKGVSVRAVKALVRNPDGQVACAAAANPAFKYGDLEDLVPADISSGALPPVVLAALSNPSMPVSVLTRQLMRPAGPARLAALMNPSMPRRVREELALTQAEGFPEYFEGAREPSWEFTFDAVYAVACSSEPGYKALEKAVQMFPLQVTKNPTVHDSDLRKTLASLPADVYFDGIRNIARHPRVRMSTLDALIEAAGLPEMDPRVGLSVAGSRRVRSFECWELIGRNVQCELDVLAGNPAVGNWELRGVLDQLSPAGLLAAANNPNLDLECMETVGCGPANLVNAVAVVMAVEDVPVSRQRAVAVCSLSECYRTGSDVFSTVQRFAGDPTSTCVSL